YYEWRSRSGCYFCFFQQKNEWIGLLKNHPDLYKKAESYEKENPETGERYTWVQKESLRELRSPDRIKQVIRDFEQRKNQYKETRQNITLIKLFKEENPEGDSCLICHL
ncbi:MAG: phosphoadenosine phosphosulfate reductase, partial [Anaerolineales bacterium]